MYFITITPLRRGRLCSRWLNLFELCDGYDAVYKCRVRPVIRAGFDHLKNKGHYITGYVIMPNHLHALIAFRNTSGKSINSIIGNGKRFMVYDIVASLKEMRQDELLTQLTSYVNTTDKQRGKLHEVFEPSFDAKECYTDAFIEQKLNYIHENPNRGTWKLVNQVWEYPHSSAKFCLTGEQGQYAVTSYMELKDVDLTKTS